MGTSTQSHTSEIRDGRKGHSSDGILPFKPSSSSCLHDLSGCPGNMKIALGSLSTADSPQTLQTSIDVEEEVTVGKFVGRSEGVVGKLDGRKEGSVDGAGEVLGTFVGGRVVVGRGETVGTFSVQPQDILIISWAMPHWSVFSPLMNSSSTSLHVERCEIA